VFISNIFNEIITKYSSVIFNFINTILVTRLLSDEGRGQYALYTNFIQFVLLFLSFSVSSSIINKVSNNKIKVGEVLISLLVYFSVVSVLISLIINYLGLSESIFRTNQNIIFILIIAVFNLFVLAINTVFFGLFYGLKSVKVPNLIKLSTVILFSVLVFFATYLERTPHQAYLIIIVIQLFVQIFQLISFSIWLLFNNKMYLNFKFNLGIKKIVSTLKDLFSFSRLVYIATLLMFFVYKIDFWIVDYYLGKKELGVYSLAVQLSQFILLLPAAIEGINLSEVSSDKEKGLKTTTWGIKAVFYGSVISSSLLFLFSYLLVDKIYGVEFIDSIKCLGILLLGIVPFTPASVISSYLIGIDRFKINLFAVIFSLGLTLIFDFILIPEFGIMGASIATSIAYITLISILMKFFLKITDQNLLSLLTIKKDEIIAIKHLIYKK
jgi:stage V sporulation protein B